MAVQKISVAEMRRLLEADKPLQIVDVRTPDEFARVHATGARLLPLDQLDPAAFQSSTMQDPIYVICQSGARATKACERLAEAGISSTLCIEGGTAAWEQMRLPVERGQSGTISLERQVRIAAGSLVLIGLILAWTVHSAFAGLSALVGAGLVFAGVTDFCGMGMLLAKMPWNHSSSVANGAAPKMKRH